MCSRLGYTYVTASSAAFQFRVNYRGTQLTASAVDNRGYVSPWGGVNWLRRTAVNRGTAAVPQCTAVYRDVVAVHRDNFHPGSRTCTIIDTCTLPHTHTHLHTLTRTHAHTHKIDKLGSCPIRGHTPLAKPGPLGATSGD